MECTRKIFGLTCVALVLSLVGCALLLDATVTGRVTVDGKPLTNGRISFYPVDKRKGMLATADVQSDGTYSLHTESFEGVLSGDYVITVVGDNSPLDEKGEPTGKPTITSPLQYSLREKSPLRQSIRRGPKEIPLALESEDLRSKLPGTTVVPK